MTSRHAQRRSVALALAAAGSLALSGVRRWRRVQQQSTATQNGRPGQPEDHDRQLRRRRDRRPSRPRPTAWAKKSGNTVEVIAASDLGQQLGQAFAGGTPAGRLLHRRLQASATSPRRATSTPTATRSRTPASCPRWCRPSPTTASSTARRRTTPPSPWSSTPTCGPRPGLTDADIPKDWAGLETVAKKLTKGKVTGLVIGNDINRGGAFMKQAGGWVVTKDGNKITADTPAEPGGPDRGQEDDDGRRR